MDRRFASRLSWLSLLAALALTPGCPSSTTHPSDAGTDGGGTQGDGGTPADGGTPTDGGTSADGGTPTDGGTPDDAAISEDAARTDAGQRTPAVHRASDAQCQAAAPPGHCGLPGGGGGPSCSMDSECTEGTNGRCNTNLGGAAICFCTYDTCTHDSDCGGSQACACHGDAMVDGSNHCVNGNCRVDADCGPGGFCSPTVGGCGGIGGYYCHTASDTCVDDADCTGIQACSWVDASRRWECVDRLFCP